MIEPLIKVDLLFPTENIVEPGSMTVQVLAPKQANKLAAVIEVRSSTSITRYVDSIAMVLQSAVFDRIRIDVRRDINIYFVESDAVSAEFPNAKYVKLSFSEGGPVFEDAGDIAL